jgi:hypothetical protein
MNKLIIDEDLVNLSKQIDRIFIVELIDKFLGKILGNM